MQIRKVRFYQPRCTAKPQKTLAFLAAKNGTEVAHVFPRGGTLGREDVYPPTHCARRSLLF